MKKPSLFLILTSLLLTGPVYPQEPPPPEPLPMIDVQTVQSDSQPIAPPAQETPSLGSGEGYNYDPTGRRDPFKPYGESQATKAPEPPKQEAQVPTEPLESFEINQFKLVGVIWNVRDPKAMVSDPNGKLHMIKKETKIGRNNGFVAAIREGEVIIVEPSVNESGMQTAVTRVLNLNR